MAPENQLPTHPTEREQRLLRQVAILAQRLLTSRPEDLDAEIAECLQQTAAVAGADRSYLTVFGRRGGPPASYEWVRRGMESRVPRQRPDSAKRYPWATAMIQSGRPIVYPDPSKLPDEATTEREQLRARGVKSLLSLPIQPAGRVIGYQIFECLDQPRDWSAAELSLLRVITEIFASSVIARRNEQALRTSEERFRALAENAPQVVAEISASGDVLYVSPQVVDLFGRRPEAVEGRSPMGYFHTDDLPVVERFVAALTRGEQSRTEARVRHEDGSWRWFDMAGRTYRNERDEPRAVVVATDVTDQRALREALRESQAQLFQSQKMEAVGRLAGGVAHDFNNLLLVIGGNLQEVLDDARLAPASREAAREAAGAVERAASLTRQLLSFSRRELVAPRPVDLNEIVGSMESLIRRLVGEHIALTVVTEQAPAVVRGDRGQFEQVLVNLAVNARDAMPEGGALEVRVETRPIDAGDARRMGLERPGLHHVLVVCDTGVGVDPRAADHIFEPFYTTKEPGEGTGLGLSIVYNVAHQAGGTVRVLGDAGDGATFEVVLPAAEGREDEPGEKPARAATRARGRLLLVEDEPAVRRLVTRMLERHGYEVRVAEDGEAALALASEGGASFDLLITDVVMPGMGGPELARRIRAELPDLSVLFVSGYPRDYRPGEAPSEDAFLPKPFTQDQLLRAVADQLGARGPGSGG